MDRISAFSMDVILLQFTTEISKMLQMFLFVILQCFKLTVSHSSDGILFPRDSEIRQTLSLDGFWDFVVPPLDKQDLGIKEKWYESDISKLKHLVPIVMPVPASYNDITTNYTIRQNVGPVWYQRHFYVPNEWKTNVKVWLRFSSVVHHAKVWINDEEVMTHSIGHLAFQNDITHALHFDKENRVTVECSNVLNKTTVPQRTVHTMTLENGLKILRQDFTFDFFNYAGIDRPVTLFTTPLTYIDDINITTDITDKQAHIHYEVTTKGDLQGKQLSIKVIDDNNVVVGKSSSSKGTISIKSPKLWWPYLMNDNPGYMYTLQVEIREKHSGGILDIYRQPFGIRTIKWNHTSLMINNKKVYLTGFGRHEDSDIRGKGLDLSLIARDYSLMRWIGSNAYRTSHYPYADEIMDMADRNGIMIIDECPSADTKFVYVLESNTDFGQWPKNNSRTGFLKIAIRTHSGIRLSRLRDFSEELLKNHKESLTELWKRDKNRPSVIMWSVSNEPYTNEAIAKIKAKGYFKNVVDHIRTLDSNRRPITLANPQPFGHDYSESSEYLDVIMINKYFGWYTHGGYLGSVISNMEHWFESYHNKYKKPMLISEYGGTALSGFHNLPGLMFTEEYQAELLSKSFEGFDRMREKGWFIGELVWNFADFQTKQGDTRPNGNKKGIFTRDRQPKRSVYTIRERYWSLAQKLNNVTLPSDVFVYVINE